METWTQLRDRRERERQAQRKRSGGTTHNNNHSSNSLLYDNYSPVSIHNSSSNSDSCSSPSFDSGGSFSCD